jgi:hypothetical protein
MLIRGDTKKSFIHNRFRKYFEKQIQPREIPAGTDFPGLRNRVSLLSCRDVDGSIKKQIEVAFLRGFDVH